MPSAYWIAFGDVHNHTERLEGIRELLAGAEGVILTGDLTFAQGAEAAQRVLDAVEAEAPVIAAQIGNMDKPEVMELFQRKGINLHGRAIKIHPLFTLIGVGGSNKTPFNTPSEFSEEEIAEVLDKALAEAGDYENLILISHTPPYDTLCDTLSTGGHAGSRAVREFIERVQPYACICGHIHEATGACPIGDTSIANPGAFADGGYVKIEIEYDDEDPTALISFGVSLHLPQ